MYNLMGVSGAVALRGLRLLLFVAAAAAAVDTSGAETRLPTAAATSAAWCYCNCV